MGQKSPMRPLLLIQPLILPLVLAACANTPPAEVAAPSDLEVFIPSKDEPCPARLYEEFIGQDLAEVSFPEGQDRRVIRPGQMVTMDYVGSRMNIYLDDEDKVVRVTCG